MTVQYRPWLPKGAIAPDGVASCIDDAILEWARCWSPSLGFRSLKLSKKAHPGQKLPAMGSKKKGKAPLKKTGKMASKAVSNTAKKLDAPPPKKAKLQYSFLGAELAVGHSENAELEIALQLLGLDISPSRVANADKPVLLALGKRCLDDLHDRVSEALAGCIGGVVGTSGFLRAEAEENSLTRAFWSGEVAGERHLIRFGFAVHEDVLVRHRRSAVKPCNQDVKLVSFGQAVDDCTIDVGARLGTASLSFSELNALETGDVLVLDRNIEENIDLTVDGNVKVLLTCVLEQDEDNFHLRVK